MAVDAFHNRGELKITATDFFKKVVEVQRIIRIEVVDHGHGIPFYLMLVEQSYPSHHLHERRPSLAVHPVFVVELLRPVDGDAHQPMLVVEEAAPLVGQQCAVGLQRILHTSAPCVLLLQADGFLVERQRAHQGLPAVPGEEHVRSGLAVHVFPDEAFQQFVAHHMFGVVGIKLAFFCVVAIRAGQVAQGTGRLGHHVQGAGEGGESSFFHIVFLKAYISNDALSQNRKVRFRASFYRV